MTIQLTERNICYTLSLAAYRASHDFTAAQPSTYKLAHWMLDYLKEPSQPGLISVPEAIQKATRELHTRLPHTSTDANEFMTEVALPVFGLLVIAMRLDPEIYRDNLKLQATFKSNLQALNVFANVVEILFIMAHPDHSYNLTESVEGSLEA